MLTFIKEILTWWNRQTIGTRLHTIFFGKFVGEDEFGNKYYENKKRKKRWVIYKGEIEATKIPVEWYSWMHSIKNKIEDTHDLKKYDWQLKHSSNLTGTDKAYNPQKNQDANKKKYKSWNN